MQENQTVIKAEESLSLVKQTKKQLFWEIFRFLLVGGTATVVDYIVFWLFDGLLFPLFPISGRWWRTLALVLATAFGFCVGLIVNWVLSVKFVFRAVKDEKRAASKKSFLIFTVIGLIGLLITEVGVLALVAALPEIKLFGTTALLNTAWEKWVAKVVMTVIVLVFNYLGRKLFVFKS